MKTKENIVQRLLEDKSINAEEAVILLKEVSIIQDFSQPPLTEAKVPFHTICGCSVCGCSVGNEMVYPKTTTQFNNPTNINSALNEMNKNTE